MESISHEGDEDEFSEFVADTFTYDYNGNLLCRTEYDGQELQYWYQIYNALNRLGRVKKMVMEIS